MKEPLARYVARRRLLTAADLLGRRSTSVADVAERGRYSSEDALVKTFKWPLGHSPGEYRQGIAERTADQAAGDAA